MKTPDVSLEDPKSSSAPLYPAVYLSGQLQI